jgi:hypothetical protein
LAGNCSDSLWNTSGIHYKNRGVGVFPIPLFIFS